MIYLIIYICKHGETGRSTSYRIKQCIYFTCIIYKYV